MSGKQKQLDRARVVCSHCHARKVRCDLEEQTGGVCSNCQKRRQVCRRRGRKSYSSSRSNNPPATLSPSYPLNTNSDAISDRNAMCTPESPSPGTQSNLSTAITTPEPQAYVGDQSFIYSLIARHEAIPRIEGINRARFSQKILKTTHATTPLSKAKVEALADSYFRHLYHRVPVIDRKDLLGKGPSPLVCQSICLIGTLLRHPGIRSPLEDSDEYYCKIKALLFANHEANYHHVLQALCLLVFRNTTPPRALSLDSSYQWLGMAIRLAYQMGLHRESTYSKLENPGNARRIMWSLYAADTLQSACFGRPSGIASSEFDIRLVQLADFELSNIQAELFIEYTKLNIILGRMVDCHNRRSEHSPEDATIILESLQEWVSNLPYSLNLYHGTERCPFRRDVYEVHINYFVCIIVFCRLFGQSLTQSTSSAASLLASSCIARLYEEINIRDEINYLMPINHWFLMVGCAPQIHHNATSSGTDQLCVEELHILMDALNYMGLKWPPARTLLGIIERLTTIDSTRPATIAETPTIYQDKERVAETWPHRMSSDLLNALFPFPRSLSPRMELIDSNMEDLSEQLAFERLADFGSDELNWIFNQYQCGFIDSLME